MRTMGKNQYKALLMRDAKQKHQLRYVGVELLDYCVFKCPHCYVKDAYHSMMPESDFYRIIDQVAECGCTWLLLTGGEPLLHPQFRTMYEYAYKKGFKVTVFTNGYLIDQEIIDCFKVNPPEMVELTLYGGTGESYDKYVGVEGAFSCVDQTIDKLVENGVHTRLKSVLMPNILEEFNAVSGYAEKKGTDFRYDGFIVPRINGDLSPCENQRLTPAQVFELDQKKKGFIEAQIERKKQFLNEANDNLYTCEAGYNSVFIDALCRMSICMFARHISIPLDKKTCVKDGQETDPYR